MNVQDASAAAQAEIKAAQDEAAARRATHILHELVPRVSTQGKIDAARQALEAKAEEAANTAWEEAKTRAGEDARERAEADAAAAAEAQAAAASAEGNGEAEGEAVAGEGADAAAQAVETAVAAAVAAVEHPQVAPVSDTDVLSALMEADAGLKDRIVTNLALARMGPGTWVHDIRFEDELVPTALEE
jgi:colicin import membrane protein